MTANIVRLTRGFHHCVGILLHHTAIPPTCRWHLRSCGSDCFPQALALPAFFATFFLWNGKRLRCAASMETTRYIIRELGRVDLLDAFSANLRELFMNVDQVFDTGLFALGVSTL